MPGLLHEAARPPAGSEAGSSGYPRHAGLVGIGSPRGDRGLAGLRTGQQRGAVCLHRPGAGVGARGPRQVSAHGGPRRQSGSTIAASPCRSSGGALHLDRLGLARSLAGGSTADGMISRTGRAQKRTRRAEKITVPLTCHYHRSPGVSGGHLRTLETAGQTVSSRELLRFPS